MDKGSNKLQVEILSASNVLSNFSNSNRFTSYLTGKGSGSPLSNNDFQKNISNMHSSPKNTVKFSDENNKGRGYSVDPSPVIPATSSKKDAESVYFLKSPLISSSDSKKNYSFTNNLNGFDSKKYELQRERDSKINSLKSETNKPETSYNLKLVRNNSMNKLANNKNNSNDTVQTQKSLLKDRPNYDLSSFVPKSFLLNSNNNMKDAIVMSPKQTKMEKVYEQIKLFQSNKKKNFEGPNEFAQSSFNSEEKKLQSPNTFNKFLEKKDTFIRVLNDTSNAMKSSNINNINNEISNKIKILSPLSSNDIFASPTTKNNKFFKKEDEMDKIYSEYSRNFKKEVMSNNYVTKENENINYKSQINDFENKNDKFPLKDNEEISEYKRLQEKLNVLEKKILSIKSNYDLTLKKNEKTTEIKKPLAKKNEFVSSSCNFYESAKEKEQRTSKEMQHSNQIPKVKKNSLEINNNNNSHTIKYFNNDLEIPETTKKSKSKNKEENTSLNKYVTQVKPHNIFPNNVYEDLFQKNLNISEISSKNEANRDSNSHVKKPANLVKASALKLIFKSDIYYISSVIKAFFFNHRNQDPDIWKEHFHQTVQAVLFTKFLKAPDEEALQSKKINLPKREFYKHKKTLIFDLDETLIHCNESSDMDSDVVLPVKFPNGTIVHAGINIRPGIKECLKELSRHYEIIVFTASHSCYANVVLNFLDPNNELIQHRLSRENCIITKEGLYIKDLRVLQNRDLKELLIIDNAAYSFGFQLENGIPILPFYKEKNDCELRNLTNYLMLLKDVLDVREINNEIFKMNRYFEFNDPGDLIKTLYSDYLKA